MSIIPPTPIIPTVLSGFGRPKAKPIATIMKAKDRRRKCARCNMAFNKGELFFREAHDAFQGVLSYHNYHLGCIDHAIFALLVYHMADQLLANGAIGNGLYDQIKSELSAFAIAEALENGTRASV